MQGGRQKCASLHPPSGFIPTWLLPQWVDPILDNIHTYKLFESKFQGFPGGSVVLRTHLPMQGTLVRSLGSGAAKPMCHNY